MRTSCSGIFLFVILLCASHVCGAEQIAGKLERVDMDTVTIRCSNNKKMVMSIERGNRRQAAPFLGKSVLIDSRQEKGDFKAVGFKPCLSKNRQ